MEIGGVKEYVAVIDQADFESFYHRKPLCLNLDPDFMNLNLQNCLVQVKASIEKGMGVLHKQVTVLMYHSLL